MLALFEFLYSIFCFQSLTNGAFISITIYHGASGYKVLNELWVSPTVESRLIEVNTRKFMHRKMRQLDSTELPTVHANFLV